MSLVITPETPESFPEPPREGGDGFVLMRTATSGGGQLQVQLHEGGQQLPEEPKGESGSGERRGAAEDYLQLGLSQERRGKGK